MVALELRSPKPAGWQGRLVLGLERRGARTVVARREHVGPLVVQRPFHPEADGTCHVYLLHPPGGVVGGDELELEVEVASGASALLTTPAATKLYRTAGSRAVVHNRLTVRPRGVLEWLPQETIAFGGTDALLATEVALDPGASFLGWEITCLGRPASKDDFITGRLDQRFSLALGARPLLIDRLLTEGGGALQCSSFGWGGRTVYGCFVAVGAPPELTSALLGPSAAGARACLGRAWGVAREMLLHKPACPPRIWAT
jgi:urease accessory protein